jgi:hypothetical protein
MLAEPETLRAQFAGTLRAAGDAPGGSCCRW